MQVYENNIETGGMNKRENEIQGKRDKRSDDGIEVEREEEREEERE